MTGTIPIYTVTAGISYLFITRHQHESTTNKLSKMQKPSRHMRRALIVRLLYQLQS